MFSESSSPYNSLEYLKYGGRTTLPSVGVHGIRRALRHLRAVRARSSPRRGASLGPWEGVFGGRARRRKPRRRATRKQLAALARGRAKLARMRRTKRRGRRGGKAGKRKFKSDLSEFYRPHKVAITQESVDNASLKALKILNKLRDVYGLNDEEFSPLPETFRLASILNKLLRFIKRGEKMGYEPVYIERDLIGQLTNTEKANLRGLQSTNLKAKAMRGGDRVGMRALVRQVLHNAGRDSTPRAVQQALNLAKRRAYEDLIDAEGMALKRNMFDDDEVKREE